MTTGERIKRLIAIVVIVLAAGAFAATAIFSTYLFFATYERQRG